MDIVSSFSRLPFGRKVVIYGLGIINEYYEFLAIVRPHIGVNEIQQFDKAVDYFLKEYRF